MFLNWQTSIMSTTASATLFLYDPATNKDFVSGATCGVLRTGTTVDSTILIDGQPTIRSATGTHGVAITFPTPLDIGSLSEWTIEWSSLPTSIGYNYSTELMLNWSGGPYMGCRWTDGGFGNRLQFSGGGTGFSNTATIWRTTETNVQAINKLAKYAMVLADGKISVYKNGIKQNMNNGTTNAITQDYFVKAAIPQPLTTLNIGWLNATFTSWQGNMGRIRISAGARYLANYTPAPF